MSVRASERLGGYVGAYMRVRERCTGMRMCVVDRWSGDAAGYSGGREALTQNQHTHTRYILAVCSPDAMQHERTARRDFTACYISDVLDLMSLGMNV